MFFIFSLAFAEPAQQADLTLAKSFEILKAQSISFKTTQNQNDIANLQLEKIRASRWFTLGLTSTHGYQNSTPRTDLDAPVPWVSRFSLDANQKIYDFGLTSGLIKAAELNAQLTDPRLEKTLLESANKLTKLYLDFSVNKSLQRLKKTQADIVEKQFSLIDESFRQGLKSRTDFLRAQVNLQRTRNDRNQINAQIAENSAKILYEIKSTVDPSHIRELPLENFAKKVIGRIHLEKNPGLILADQDALIAQSELSVTHLKNGPEVNLKSIATYGSSDYMGTGQRMIDNARTTWAGLLEFNVPIWDARQKSFDVEIAAKKVQATILVRDLLKETSSQEINISLEQLKIHQNNLSTARELTKLEDENFTFAESEYRGGRVNLFYLNDSLKTLIDARTAEIQALAECARGYFQIKNLTGELLDEIRAY